MLYNIKTEKGRRKNEREERNSKCHLPPMRYGWKNILGGQDDIPEGIEPLLRRQTTI